MQTLANISEVKKPARFKHAHVEGGETPPPSFLEATSLAADAVGQTREMHDIQDECEIHGESVV